MIDRLICAGNAASKSAAKELSLAEILSKAMYGLQKPPQPETVISQAEPEGKLTLPPPIKSPQLPGKKISSNQGAPLRHDDLTAGPRELALQKVDSTACLHIFLFK